MTAAVFDRQRLLTDLATFAGFKTVVCRNPEELRRANAWIRGLFDSAKTEIVDFWPLFSKDEEVGSEYGVKLVADHLAERDLLPPSPSMGAAHAADECLDTSSLDAYYELCLETARMRVHRG